MYSKTAMTVGHQTVIKNNETTSKSNFERTCSDPLSLINACYVANFQISVTRRPSMPQILANFSHIASAK